MVSLSMLSGEIEERTSTLSPLDFFFNLLFSPLLYPPFFFSSK